MRIPSFHRYGRLMQALAIFVCGMIVGGAVYSALENDIVNKALIENVELREQLDALKVENDKAQKLRNANDVLRSITLFVDAPGDKSELDVLTVAELKKAMKKDLDIFIGRSIYEFHSDAELARALLQSKTYDNIGGKQYKIAVRTILLVDDVLQMWVDASVYAGP